MKRADYYFEKGQYKNALDLYTNIASKERHREQLELKMARTYLKLNDCFNSSIWYAKHLQKDSTLTSSEYIDYADMLACSGQYELAIEYYKIGSETDTLSLHEGVIDKIWQLSNIQTLYEDSIKYLVKPIEINTPGPEFSPIYYSDGIVFMHEDTRIGGVQKLDSRTDSPFLSPYYSKIELDTIQGELEIRYGKPEKFAREIPSKYNRGKVAFFSGDEKMVFSKNSSNGNKTLQLYFAELDNGKWVETEAFPYNSAEYSLYHPALNKKGTTLYFVSDMPEGEGGKDLYKSDMVNGVWQQPVNLGKQINTPGNEVFPFYHEATQTLCFSSDGHPGFGGLDIFKSTFNENKIYETRNLGYPINTSFDDFGITLNATGSNGYISSNRYNGGLDDNIFEIEIDLQSYPLLISGNVKIKSNIDISKEAESLPFAKLSLIDLNKNVEVSNTTSNEFGSFKLTIPYSSQYVIRITTSEGNQTAVSINIPKDESKLNEFHLVVIEDIFDNNQKINNDDSELK